MHKAEYISDRFFSTMVKVQSSGHAGRTLATDGCWWKRTRLIGQRLAVQAEARLEDHFQLIQSGLGLVKGMEVKLVVEPEVSA